MPRLERTRRATEDQLGFDFTVHTPPSGWADEVEAQNAATHVSAQLQVEMGPEDDAVWAGSPYEWVRHLPAARKGKVGERLAAGLLSSAGHIVGPSRGTAASFTMGDVRIKVKLSMLWATGEFVFQQLETTEADYLCLVAVEPSRVRLWVAPTFEVRQHLHPTTRWLSISASETPAWLSRHGGSLQEGVRAAAAAASAETGELTDSARGPAAPTGANLRP